MCHAGVCKMYQLPGMRSAVSNIDIPEGFRKTVISFAQIHSQYLSKLVHRTILLLNEHFLTFTMI
jgi:hypothetical protein